MSFTPGSGLEQSTADTEKAPGPHQRALLEKQARRENQAQQREQLIGASLNLESEIKALLAEVMLGDVGAAAVGRTTQIETIQVSQNPSAGFTAGAIEGLSRTSFPAPAL